MQALRTLTSHPALPDNAAQLAAFEQKFAKAATPIWRECSIAFSILLELNIRISFEKLIKKINDMIYCRIVYYSEDPQSAPISLITGDVRGACGMIRAGIQEDNTVEDLEFVAYAKANLDFDQDGWVRRIPGTRTIGKSKAHRQAERDLFAMDINPCPDYHTYTQEYIATFEERLKECGFERR